MHPTILMEKRDGYDFDWDGAEAALAYMSNACGVAARRGHVWCLVRRDRRLSRFVTGGGREAFSDAPDTAQREGTIAREVATDIPMLMLFRQEGAVEQGWRGTPFYWPVIWAPANTRTAIYAETT